MPFQIRNITNMQQPLHSSDGDTAHIPPKMTVTVHDKFDWSIDPTKFRVVTPSALAASVAGTAAANALSAQQESQQQQQNQPDPDQNQQVSVVESDQ